MRQRKGTVSAIKSDVTVVEQPEPKARPKRSARWGASLLVLALLVGVLAPAFYAARPRTELERYVSPPLDVRGTRLDLLIPSGWKLDRLYPKPDGDQGVE